MLAPRLVQILQKEGVMLYFQSTVDGSLLTQRELCREFKTNPAFLSKHIKNVWLLVKIKKSQIVWIDGKRFPTREVNV